MVRQNLTTNSTFAAIVATPSVSGVNFVSRLTSGGNMLISSNAFQVNYPYTWLRLQRNGSSLTAFGSFDGINWQVARAATISVTDAVYFGYAVASKSNLGLTALFRDLSVSSAMTVGNVAIPF